MENDIRKNIQNIESLLGDKQGEETLKKIKDYLEIKEKINNEFYDYFTEIVHAKWTKMETDMCYWYVCSHCGHDVPENRYHNDWFSDWCPNCGARMYMENDLG